MLHFIKVLNTKMQNSQLQESIAPMKPRQLTQGEFKIKLLWGLMQTFQDGNSSSNDLDIWLMYYNWISSSFFFPNRNKFFNEVKETFILYLEKYYPKHKMLEKLK